MSKISQTLQESAQLKRRKLEVPQSELEYDVIIEPKSGWRLIDWKEIVEHRDLFRFLIWRSIKVQYAQSALGIGWALIQPLFSMIIFAIVFGKLAGVKSDGVSYPVFSLTALVPWTYFANALTEGASSLVGNANMLSKIYFPRLMLPLSAVCAKLVDFCIAIVLLAGLMFWYGIAPNLGILLVPYLIGLMILTASGLATWLASLAIQYRDVKYAMSFIVQALMYCSPVVYPASLVPWTYGIGDYVIYPRLMYAANPMVGVIEGFRSALLVTNEMPFGLIAVGTIAALIVAVTGCLYFRRKERLFADVA